MIVYGISSAAIPHLVDLAPYLSAPDRRRLWVHIGLLVAGGADRFPSPPAAGLQEGLTAAIRVAADASVRDFLADTAMSAGDALMFGPPQRVPRTTVAGRPHPRRSERRHRAHRGPPPNATELTRPHRPWVCRPAR